MVKNKTKDIIEEYPKEVVCPENIFFIPQRDSEDETYYVISVNGGTYPSIIKAKKLLSAMEYFVSGLEELGKDKIDKINEDILDDIYNGNQDDTENKVNVIDGYIYVLKSNGLYKIGRAKNIQGRLKTYTTENPFGIEVIIKREVRGFIEKEKFLLDLFKEKKYRGEWFNLIDEDIDFINDYLSQDGK